MKSVIRVALQIVLGLVMIGALVAGGYALNNLNYFQWGMRAVNAAGFVEKQVLINGSQLHYAVGPDNGPPLLLIHGQGTDWKSYFKVLPELAKHYHIYAVDCYGHGGSARAPEKYSAVALGRDLEQFIVQVIGKPSVVSGHSSGGLVAAWLAAYAPTWVRGVVLEDPPFFSSVLPRALKTFNYVDLSVICHNFLISKEPDFVAYYLRHSILLSFFKGAQQPITDQGLGYRAKHPHEPLKLWFMPPVFNELFRGLQSYDCRFAEAFYNNSFHQNFDHAETLSNIHVPAVLIHTNWSYDTNGILLAAMDARDAERARSLIQGVQFFKVNSGHGFHFEKPGDFIKIMLDFKNRLGK